MKNLSLMLKMIIFVLSLSLATSVYAGGDGGDGGDGGGPDATADADAGEDSSKGGGGAADAATSGTDPGGRSGPETDQSVSPNNGVAESANPTGGNPGGIDPGLAGRGHGIYR